MLRAARCLGDELIVVLSHDAHNRKANAVPSARRRRQIEALGIADRVFVGQPDSFAASPRAVKPYIPVLGYDLRPPDGETAQAVRELGVRLVVMPWYPGKERSCYADNKMR